MVRLYQNLLPVHRLPLNFHQVIQVLAVRVVLEIGWAGLDVPALVSKSMTAVLVVQEECFARNHHQHP